jgi:membrane fusion protein (multidrug efflux system)
MNRKKVLIALAVVAGGSALYAWLRMTHRSGGATESEAAVATLVSVQTGHLQRATLHGYVGAFGVAGPAPATDRQPAAGAHVAPAVAGVVTEVKVAEGQHVEAGSVMFQLNSQAADVAVEFARKALERQQKLLQMNNTSQKAVQDAEQQLAAAKAQQALLRVTSPLSGTVTHVYVRPGEAVDLTTVLADVTDLSRLVVAANIPAAQAGELKPGQAVELATEPPLNTSLSFVGPSVDVTNDTVLVWAPVPAGGALRPGQFVRLRIVSAEHVDCLAAPAGSVVTDPAGQEVIAVVTRDEATQVPVKAGLREGGLVEVEGAGLKPGDTVVTVGAYGLPKQTKIRVVNP